MVGTLAKPHTPRRPSSVGLREAVTYLRQVDTQGGKEKLAKDLEEMQHIQEHNEAVFEFAKTAASLAEEAQAKAAEAERQQREAAQADADAIGKARAALDEDLAAFARAKAAQEDAVGTARKEAAELRAEMKRREGELRGGRAEVTRAKEANTKAAGENAARASGLNSFEAKLKRRDERLRTAMAAEV